MGRLSRPVQQQQQQQQLLFFVVVVVVVAAAASGAAAATSLKNHHVPLKTGGTEHQTGHERRREGNLLSLEVLEPPRQPPAGQQHDAGSTTTAATALLDMNSRTNAAVPNLAVDAQAQRLPRSYRSRQIMQGGNGTKNYTTVGLGYCRGWSAANFGYCAGSDLVSVNGRAKDGFSNESGCAAACDALSACVAYAYAGNDCGPGCYATFAGRCYVYGPGLEQGLRPFEIQSHLIEWEGTPHDNVEVKCSSGALGVICRRESRIPLYQTCVGNKHIDTCGKVEACGCTNSGSTNFDANAKIDDGSCLCQASDKRALLAAIIPSSLNFRHLTDWDKSSDPCAAWGGVTCEAGRVTKVDFSGCDARHMLQFELGPGLRALEELIYLNLALTKLEGTLPRELGSLQKLEHLILDFTAISGTFPQTIGNLSRLRSLRFVQSQHPLPQWNKTLNTISGTLPHSVDGLVSLQHFQVVASSLSGTLPQSLYNLSLLQFLCFSSTLLSGTVSEKISGALALQQFLFGFTSISGSIPAAMFGLSALQIFNVVGVTQLSGTISTSLGSFQLQQMKLAASQVSGTLSRALGSLEKLESLEVQLTDLSGTLPDTIGNMVNLQHLQVDKLSISGTLPTNIGGLAQLEGVAMADTMLSGTIPPSVFQMPALTGIFLPSSFVSGTLSPEVGQLTGLLSVDLSHIPMSGSLPQEMSKLLGLLRLTLPSTLISGSLPDLRNCTRLNFLDVTDCAFTRLPPALPPTLEIAHLGNNPFAASSAEISALFQTSPRIQSLNLASLNIPVQLSPGGSTTAPGGTRVTPPQGCTVGGYCAFRLDLMTVGFPVTQGRMLRNLTIGYNNKRALMEDMGNGSLLAKIDPNWICTAGPKIFHFYHNDDEFQPGVTANGLPFQSDDPTCSGRIKADVGLGGCTALRTVNFEPRLCPEGSYTEASANGSVCVCMAGFEPNIIADASILTCHRKCVGARVVATDGASCRCVPGTYDTETTGEVVCITTEWLGQPKTIGNSGCLPCPNQCAACSKAGTVTLLPGWRLNATNELELGNLINRGQSGRLQVALACPGAAYHVSPACPPLVLSSTPGTNMNLSTLSCSTPYTGILCASCERGFSLTGGSCISCNKRMQLEEHYGLGGGIVVILFVVVAGVVVVLTKIQWNWLSKIKDEIQTPAKIVLGLMQVLSLLKTVLNLAFPANTEGTLTFVGIIAFDIQHFVQVDCIVSWTFYEKWTFIAIALPAVGIFAVGLFYAWQFRNGVAAAKTNAVHKLSFIILLFYPQVSSHIFSMLRCRQLGSSLSVLEADYSVSCETDKYGRYRFMAYVLVLVWPLGIPLGLSWLLLQEWRSSRKKWQGEAGLETSLIEFHCSHIQDQYAFCTKIYRPECFWFEPVDMLRKLALTGLLQLVDRGSAFQVLVGCAIAFVSFGIQQRVQPYMDLESNILKGMVDVQIFFTFLISFILRVLVRMESYERLGPTFYGSLLVWSFACILLMAAGLFVKKLRRKRAFESRLLEDTAFEMTSSVDRSVFSTRGVSGVFTAQRPEPP